MQLRDRIRYGMGIGSFVVRVRQTSSSNFAQNYLILPRIIKSANVISGVVQDPGEDPGRA